MRLIKAANDTNSQILVTDNGLQIWRHGFKTPAYRKICKAQECFEEIALKYVREKQLELENRLNADSETDAKSLLEIYLTSAELDSKDVVTMVSDMLLAGIDTVSKSVTFFVTYILNIFILECIHYELHLVPFGKESFKASSFVRRNKTPVM